MSQQPTPADRALSRRIPPAVRLPVLGLALAAPASALDLVLQAWLPPVHALTSGLAPALLVAAALVLLAPRVLR